MVMQVNAFTRHIQTVIKRFSVPYSYIIYGQHAHSHDCTQTSSKAHSSCVCVSCRPGGSQLMRVTPAKFEMKGDAYQAKVCERDVMQPSYLEDHHRNAHPLAL